MNWNIISTVFRKELRDSVRDKRTLISTLVVPTVVIPVLFFGAGFVMKKVISKAQEEASSVMIIGGEDSPAVVAAITANEEFNIVPTRDDYKDAVSNKEIRIAVDIPPGFDAAITGDKAPTLKIYHYQGEMKSNMGRNQMRNFLFDYREDAVQSALAARGLPETLAKPFEVETENVAPPEKVGGNAVGGFVPYMIVILCFTGAMYPAMDLTAGEKERGTMETLLCSPVNRINIVMGKFLMVLAASAATVALTVVMMGVSAVVAGKVFASGAVASGAGAGAEGGGMGMLIDPLGLVGVFAMVVPVAMLFAAVQLTVALFAKSFKEAQSYVSPLMIVVIMPTAMGMLPGIELTAKTAMIPIMNLSLVCKEMLSGVWNWHYIALIFGSSAVYAGIALWLCVKMFDRESVMFRA
ncbi:ABC transporter permease [Synoicihabitans lomoniglobus]|uniref:ABC transporter permease n=1 Tax=Synoicihabitans lomoniglobus TaxID=2909285 RepID=A0AAF0CHC9_9BACT|nr:ABC transporter permease [Opitutaceae bacterium LMO-M01]WED64157.1 ABC transporter permease [Opitutaceae bacterium LMO-M01]